MNRSIIKYEIRHASKSIKIFNISDKTIITCADLLFKKILEKAIKNNVVVANKKINFEVVQKQKSIFEKKEKILIVYNDRISEDIFAIKIPLELQNKIDSSLIPYRNVSQ